MLAEHREDPHTEVVEDAELLDIPLLELFLGEREEFDVRGDFGRVYHGDIRGHACRKGEVIDCGVKRDMGTHPPA